MDLALLRQEFKEMQKQSQKHEEDMRKLQHDLDANLKNKEFWYSVAMAVFGIFISVTTALAMKFVEAKQPRNEIQRVEPKR